MNKNQQIFLAIVATAGVVYLIFRNQAQASALSTTSMSVPNWMPNSSTITNFGTNGLPLVMPWATGKQAYSLSGARSQSLRRSGPLAFCC